MPDAPPSADRPGLVAQRVALAVVLVFAAATALHVVLLPHAVEEPDEPPAPSVDEGDEASSAAVLGGAGAVLTKVQLVAATVSDASAPTNPIDADRAFGYLERLCDLGPRPSGSAAMRRQQELLVAHFEPLADEVTLQRFQGRNPLGGPRVPMANVVARWRPDAADRVLLCAHYDTRPLPDRDPNPVARRNGRFVGANDGASGTALLMELAHLMPGYDGPWGIDFVLFDAEELVYNDRRDPYFLGSRWFARKYAQRQPKDWSYRWGVLLDMVGDADLQLYWEKHGFRDPASRPLAKRLWATAARLGVSEFVPREKHEVLDDHVALRRYGGIPTIDIIDFDYPYWHTEADTPRKCSGESLAKVGWVVWEWLNEPAAAGGREKP